MSRRTRHLPVGELRVFPRPDTAAPRQVVVGQALVVAWLGLVVALAVWTGRDVHDLGRVSDLLGSSGATLGATAADLRHLQHLPGVGAAAARAARQVSAAASAATSNASSSRAGIDQLGWLLGVAIATIAGLPALAVLGRFRLERGRERRALRAALADPGRRRGAERHLAGRATLLLPYRDLHALPDTGTEALAAAEAQRLGLR